MGLFAGTDPGERAPSPPPDENGPDLEARVSFMAGQSSDADLTRVLLVEDNPHDRVAVRRSLDKATGFQLTNCPSAEQALDLTGETLAEQDVIVVDHGLPGISGQELCRELLQRPQCPPLVVLTGSGSELLAVDCLKTGVADYLVKDPAQDYLALLPLILKNVVKRHRERLGLEQAERALIEEGLRRKILLGQPAGGGDLPGRGLQHPGDKPGGRKAHRLRGRRLPGPAL